MSWFNRFERALEPIAIPHLTLYLVIGQTFVYLTAMLGLLDPEMLILVPSWVLDGEVWRLFTFVFTPPSANWVFIAFALYFLYLTGNTLEEYWGVVRYNLFLLTGFLLTVGLAFVTPDRQASNLFISGAIFLAFAYLNPDFELRLFFVLPVKIKWMALLTWLYFGYLFVTGGLSTRLSIAAGVGNFLIFFGRDLVLDLKAGRRRQQMQARRVQASREEAGPRHVCHVCGKNSDTHPELDFRYCSKCAGDQCYCPDHIRSHEHVTEETAPRK